MPRIDLAGKRVLPDDKSPKNGPEWARSTASYRAFRLASEPGTFILARLPHLDDPLVELGRCKSEERAERMVDWWVLNDLRVAKILEEKSHESIEDLVIECARAVPKFDSGVPPRIVCAKCLGTGDQPDDLPLHIFHYSYDDDRLKQRRATVYLHLTCVGTYLVSAAGRALWATGGTVDLQPRSEAIPVGEVGSGANGAHPPEPASAGDVRSGALGGGAEPLTNHTGEN